jgi:NADPH2:quinone reductase
MHVIEVPQYGSADVLREVERDTPEPGAGEARVAVAATTLNPIDVDIRAGAFDVPGLKIPFVLGWDLSGTLLDDLDGLRAGQRVVAMVPWMDVPESGTNAEVVVVEPEWVAPLPDDVDLVVAATLPLNGLTARQTLDLARVQSGQSVFVDRGSAGVGGFAVQIAAQRGARVLAVAADADDAAYVAELGAEHVLQRGEPAALADQVRSHAPGGADIAIDTSGVGAPLLSVVRDGGTFVTVAGPPPASERDIRVERQYVAPDREQLASVVADHVAGRLTTRVADTLPLSRAAEAHRRLEAGGVRGKIVLTTLRRGPRGVVPSAHGRLTLRKR